MPKFALRFAMLIAFVAAAIIVNPSPSMANQNTLTRGRPWQCRQDNTGWYCLYDHKSYNTNILHESAYVFMGWYCGTYDMPSAFWDKASSWQNRQSSGSRVGVNSWRTRPDYEHLWNTGGAPSWDDLVDSVDNDKADWTANSCA